MRRLMFLVLVAVVVPLAILAGCTTEEEPSALASAGAPVEINTACAAPSPGGTIHTITTSLHQIDWEAVLPGHIVCISYKSTPYNERVYVTRPTNLTDPPIVIRGIPSSEGKLPVIEGNGAAGPPCGTPTPSGSGNALLGVLMVDGSSSPNRTRNLTIENLELRGALDTYSTTYCDSTTMSMVTAPYDSGAAAVYVKDAENITIRNLSLTNSHHGLLIHSETKDVLVEASSLFNAGAPNQVRQHNTYAQGDGVTFQFNRFGGICDTCEGNNLKSRSTRYTKILHNYFEGRSDYHLDLVDNEDTSPTDITQVAGNIFIDPDVPMNKAVVNFGGDIEEWPNRSALDFFNNTLIARRASETDFIRVAAPASGSGLSLWNNIFWAAFPSQSTILTKSTGGTATALLENNWLRTLGSGNDVIVHDGSISIDPASVYLTKTSDPGFVADVAGGADEVRIKAGAAVQNQGKANVPALVSQYREHSQSELRYEGVGVESPTEVGAYAFRPPYQRSLGTRKLQAIPGQFLKTYAYIAAESFHGNRVGSGKSWTKVTGSAYENGEAMQVQPEGRVTHAVPGTATPRLEFQAYFLVGGTFKVWVRGKGPNTSSDRVSITLDRQTSSNALDIEMPNSAVAWRGLRANGTQATLSVPSVGYHTITVWMRDDGFVLDEIFLTSGTGGPSDGPNTGDGDFEADANGDVMVEAEHQHLLSAVGGLEWLPGPLHWSPAAGYTGQGAVKALPDVGAVILPEVESKSAELRFQTNIPTAGRKYVYVRGRNIGSASNSVYLGLTRVFRGTPATVEIPAGAGWVWATLSVAGNRAFIDLERSGYQDLSLWIREDGVEVDKVVLSPSSTLNPDTVAESLPN